MDTHLIIIIIIMIISGAFGGFLNYLHKFDTTELNPRDPKDPKGDPKDPIVKYKYILLGIGAAFLVPVFLKMISSNLASSNDNNDYLIFAGFCLITAIFSRRFITTIGERILEAAKNAEKTAQESKQEAKRTQLELTNTKERIEDVKLAVDLKTKDPRALEKSHTNQKEKLFELCNSFIEKTSVPDYSQRIKLKAELGRQMGEIIVRNNLRKDELLDINQSEGMLLALSYSVELRPDSEGLSILNKISKLASQLYTKYKILVAYGTLARNGFIDKSEVHEIYGIIKSFRSNADRSLIKKIDETLSILNTYVAPDIKE